MSARSKVLDISNIIRILPHKPPAILIDRILELSPGSRIVAQKNITATEPIFAGHFPGLPVFPAAMIIEAMLQTCAVLAYATDKFDPSTEVVTLNGLNKTRFHRTIGPGSVMEIEAEISQRRSNIYRFNASSFVDDQIVCETGLVMALLDRADFF